MDEMNNKAFEELAKGIRRDNVMTAVVFCLIGVLCLGFSLAAFLDILPSALYAEEATAAEREWETFFYVVLGAVGLVIVASVIWAIISRPGPPEGFWSDNW